MFPVHLPSKGHMAWDDTLLAVGSSSLSLFTYQSAFTELQTIPTKSPISFLEWSKTSEVVLATGSPSGTISFYKKSSLLSDPSKSFLKEDKLIENTNVGSLQFCPSKPNLLAVGANELFIYNLETGLTGRDPTKYVFKLGKNNNDAKRLTSISWNPQVQYILAAATQNCAASVWDLRGNQTLFNVHDPNYLNKSICSGIVWNPDIPTQFIMAYDDSTAPNLQIWDLRKHEQPVKELKTNHQDGITGLSWCPYDSSVFASSDRSGYTNFWNFKQCQTFMTATHSAEAVPVSIKWIPKHPGTIAFGFENGEIEVRNIYTPAVNIGSRVLYSDQNTEVTKGNTVYTPVYIPKKGNCAFGYNGKLAVSASNHGKISLNQLTPSETPLKPKIHKAHKLYSDGKLAELCAYFSENSTETGKIQWEIISSKLSGNISNLISLLGFDRKTIEKNTEKLTGKKRSLNEEDPAGHKDFQDTFSFVDLSAVDAVDFFNKAGAKHEEVKHQVETLKSEPEFVQSILETISKNVNWEEGSEKLIRENVILGNLEAAIDCALTCGRTAEALIIAAEGGTELFNMTRDLVLSGSKDKYLRSSFLPLLTKNVSQIIEKIDHDKWKEALSLIIINNSNTKIISQFAEKLEEAGLFEPAEVCYLYSGNSEKVVESWVKEFKKAVNDGKSYETETFNLFFKALLYSESFSFPGNELVERVYLEYLSLVFRKGLVAEGLEIMRQLRTPKHCESYMMFVEKHTKASTGASKGLWKIFNILPVKGKNKEVARQGGVREANELKKNNAVEPGRFQPTMPEPNKNSYYDTGKNVLPQPVKNAFPAPVKNAFPAPVKSAFPESVKSTVPEPVKPVFPPPVKSAFSEQPKATDQPKPAFKDINKINVPPPPAHHFPDPKKAAFTEKTTQKSEERPPPPKKEKETKIDSPPTGQVRQTEHPADIPNPVTRVTEERKVPPPAVPKAPPPRAVVPVPSKIGAKPAAKEAEGLDLSLIPASLMPIASTWANAIFDSSIAANARIQKDVEAKMQELFNKLKNQELSDNTLSLVKDLTQAFESGDFASVNKYHLELTNKTWTENGNWLTGMKRIIQARQAKGK